MADFRDHYDEINAEGVELMAVAVDEPERSEAFRKELDLPFAILCDTTRDMLQSWDILNRWEMGGIARPAIAVVDEGRVVRFIKKGKPAVRVTARGILEFLREGTEPDTEEITLP